MSIRTKLSVLTCVVAFAAVTLTSLGFSEIGFKHLRATEAKSLQNHARLMGHFATPILTLRNRSAGDRLLDSLSSDPSIEAACLFDMEHECLSRYGAEMPIAFPSHLEGTSHQYSERGRLEFLKQVEVSSQPIGFVYLRSNTTVTRAELLPYGLGAGVLACVVFALTNLMAIPFKRAISNPIQRLVETTADLSKATHPMASEIDLVSPECSQVMQAVNQLVSTIEKSEQAALHAATGMEARVAERKHGLAIELKRLQKRCQELECANGTVENASRAKTRFIVDMIREVSEPLDAMVEGLQKFRSGSLELSAPDAKAQLDVMRRDGLNLQALLRDVSKSAIDETERLVCQPVECRPQAIVADVIETYRDHAVEKELVLEYAWRGSENETLWCDPSQLRQMVDVLVNNAIRYTEMGGVRVSARFDQGQDGRQLRIEVTDTGIGMSHEKIDQLFVSPDSGGGSRTRLGIVPRGLLACQTIVSTMGGHIAANSSVGEGTVFTLTINAETAPTSTAGNSPREEDQIRTTTDSFDASRQNDAGFEQSPDTNTTTTPKILVVDDSDTNRDLVQLVLRRAGARVEGAENGLDAVQAAIRESFDLILMDMQMPVMDGYSATREIRAQGIDVPIIALTAFARDFDEQKCLAAGCNGHLTKPIDSDHLLSAAQRVLPSNLVLSRSAPTSTRMPHRGPSDGKATSSFDVEQESQTIA